MLNYLKNSLYVAQYLFNEFAFFLPPHNSELCLRSDN